MPTSPFGGQAETDSQRKYTSKRPFVLAVLQPLYETVTVSSRPSYHYYYYYFFDPGTQFPGTEKIALCNTKKYKNQAGMNLTPPPPSQNSHAVR